MNDADDIKFNEWMKSLEDKPFKEASEEVLNKVLVQVDSKSQRFIRDVYEFFIKRVDSKSDFQLESLKTYLVDLKGYPLDSLHLPDIMRAMLIMSLCGFDIKAVK